MKLTFMKLYLIGTIAFLLVIGCIKTVVPANIQKHIASMAVSDNLLYIGEYGGRIQIFDIKRLAVVARPFVCGKGNNVQIMKLINDNGRILAAFDWGFIGTAICEVTPKGDVKKVGALPGRLKGLDNEYFYCSRYVSEKSTDRYEAFLTRYKDHYEVYRFDKGFKVQKKGHIPGYPNLMIYTQAEDVHNYYFFCSLETTSARIKRGFALVSKSKVTGQIEVSRFPQDVKWTSAAQDKEWISAEMTCDQESIWLFLFLKNGRLFHYSKKEKKLTATPYTKVTGLIRNLSETELPPWSFAGHEANQILPISHSTVQKERVTDAQPVFNKHLYYNRWSLIYGENLWSVTSSRNDDDSIFHLTRIPILSGDPEVFKIQPTHDDKIDHTITGIKRFFEGLGMIIFGE